MSDPYSRRSDRYGYGEGEFDTYKPGEAGMPFAFGGGDSGGGGASMDFSEADGETLVSGDENFEDDLSAS